MKLIMENWRKNAINEAQVRTVQDMIGVVRAIMAIKRGEQLTGTVMNIASAVVGGMETLKMLEPAAAQEKLMSALGLAGTAMDILSGAADIKDVVTKFSGLPDSQRSQAGYLQMLDFDDQYLQMLDNNLDNDILNYVLQKLEASTDANISSVNVNAWLEEFITQTFQRAIAGAPEQAAGDVKKRGKLGVAGARARQTVKRIKGDVT